MVTIEEMAKSKGHNVLIKIYEHSPEKVFVENLIFEEGEDEEPMLLFTANRAELQSDIESIEIL